MVVSVRMFGCRLRLCGGGELLDAVAAHAASGEPLTVLSGNVHALNLAAEHRWLCELFSAADLVRVDGAGLRLGARLLGHRLPPRATWADFGWELAERCAAEGLPLYLLGARPGVAERAAARLVEAAPALRVAGTHHGYFDHRPESEESRQAIAAVNASGAAVLIVGFGMPRQERWLAAHRHLLTVPVVLTAGAAFDYLSGEQRRGPRWMTDHGFEWLARLLIEPRRLWRRYLVGNPSFLWRVWRQRRAERRAHR